MLRFIKLSKNQHILTVLVTVLLLGRIPPPIHPLDLESGQLDIEVREVEDIALHNCDIGMGLGRGGGEIGKFMNKSPKSC